MTQQNAERTATVLMGVAAVAAAVVVLRDARLRRRAWQLASAALTASGAWLIAEARHAWGDASPPSVRTPAPRAGAL